MNKVISLVAALLIPMIIAGIGGYFTSLGMKQWYGTLKLPPFTPPGYLFGPVWTVLYLSMGFASWMVWNADRTSGAVRIALILYAVQLLLNLLWSILFFGLQSPMWALVDIFALNLAVLATIISFWRVSGLSGGILIPYMCWLLFATALNWWIAFNNPH